jgi:hypothetical protein
LQRLVAVRDLPLVAAEEEGERGRSARAQSDAGLFVGTADVAD